MARLVGGVPRTSYACVRVRARIGLAPGARRAKAAHAPEACKTLPVPQDYFGERVAERYDELSAEMFDPAVVEPSVAFLAELAGHGGALEFGIGTGRIALPLAQRGIRVHGIDLSEAMVARLRAKPGGEGIPVTMGGFATTTVDETFSLVYLVFNTIVNLITQDEQVACFQNAAAHLEPGGSFVIEVGVPSLRRLPPGESVNVVRFSETYFCLNEFDVARQALVSHHLTAPPTTRSRGGRSPSATCGRRNST